MTTKFVSCYLYPNTALYYLIKHKTLQFEYLQKYCFVIIPYLEFRLVIMMQKLYGHVPCKYLKMLQGYRNFHVLRV